MKEQAYNIIKTKDSRTQRQSNLKKFKEARFKISPQEFEDRTLGEIEMDNPDITMEEYIQLEAKKVCRHGQEFNWETATYGKVRYFEDIDYFKDFETDFPAIYKDHSEGEVTETMTKPTLREYREEIQADGSNTTTSRFNKSAKLEQDSNNDNDEIDIKQSSEDISVEPLPDVISIDTQGSNNLLETSHDTISKFFTANT
ncbi:hypothetical protein Tco_0773376 [Tanacetum coccineum]|uniref:Uncharacterized protein n=1 Tax=Tanacetum coccineum TaxID=301880 RepID=A0ABQ4ZLG4_9ASTR